MSANTERRHCVDVANAIFKTALTATPADVVDIIMRERAAARAEVEAEVLALRAERDQLQKDLRECRRNLQVTTDAHGAAELRIVELREALQSCLTQKKAQVGAVQSARMDRDNAIADLDAEREANQVIWGADVSEMRAKVARVEALATQWRASSRKYNGRGCAGELEAALRGEGE